MKEEKPGKLYVVYDSDKCLGCGMCCSICPKFWEIGSDSKACLKGAVANRLEIAGEDLKCSLEALNGCVANAISITDENGKEIKG